MRPEHPRFAIQTLFAFASFAIQTLFAPSRSRHSPRFASFAIQTSFAPLTGAWEITIFVERGGAKHRARFTQRVRGTDRHALTMPEDVPATMNDLSP